MRRKSTLSLRGPPFVTFLPVIKATAHDKPRSIGICNELGVSPPNPQKFRKVFAGLPKRVRGAIQRVRAEAPFYDVKTGKHTPGPLLVFADKLNECCRELGRPQWGNTDGFTYWFDADVVLNERTEVSSFLIAQMLACTYQVAIRGKHGLEQKGIDLEVDSLVKEWGFHLLSDSGKPLVAKTYTIWNQS